MGRRNHVRATGSPYQALQSRVPWARRATGPTWRSSKRGARGGWGGPSGGEPGGDRPPRKETRGAQPGSISGCRWGRVRASGAVTQSEEKFPPPRDRLPRSRKMPFRPVSSVSLDHDDQTVAKHGLTAAGGIPAVSAGDVTAHGIRPLGAGRQQPPSPQHSSPQESGCPAGSPSLPVRICSASQNGRSAHRGCRTAGFRSGVPPRPPLGTPGRPSRSRCARGALCPRPLPTPASRGAAP